MLIERKTYGAGYGIASMERDLFEEAQAARELREGMSKPRVGDTVWYDGEKAAITDVRPDSQFGGWKVELDVGGQKVTVNPGLSLEFGSKNDQQTKRKRQTLLQALRGAVSRGGQSMPDTAFSSNPMGESVLARRIRQAMAEGVPGVSGEAPGPQSNPSPTDYKEKSISEIASAIRKHWKAVNYAAKPYLSAMIGMEEIDDDYGAEPGREMVARFLANAGSFKGPEAKVIKTELKRRLGRK